MLVAAGSFLLPSAASGSAEAAACSSGGVCIAVDEWANGVATRVESVTSAQITAAADVAKGGGASACYETRAQPGKSGGSLCINNGLSMHRLLTGDPTDGLPGVPGADLSAGGFTAVPRADGTWSTLTNAQLQDPTVPGTFQDPSRLPVVWYPGDTVDYLRPLTSAKDDTNAADHVSMPDDTAAPLTVYFFSGDPLAVSTNADKLHVPVGKPVQFSSTVSDSGTTPQPGSLTYSWSFGDGATASTANPTHTFTTDNNWLVLLTVTGTTDGSGGMSKPLTITVGTPTKKPTAPSPGGPSPSPHSSPPPAKPPAATPPASHRPPHGTAHPDTHSGKGSKRARLPSLGSFGGLPGSVASRLGSELTGQQPQVANGAGLPLVSGQIVGGGAPLSLSQAASESSTLATSPADAETTRWTPGVVPIYVAAVLVLLGVGIGRERGWRRPRRR